MRRGVKHKDWRRATKHVVSVSGAQVWSHLLGGRKTNCNTPKLSAPCQVVCAQPKAVRAVQEALSSELQKCKASGGGGEGGRGGGAEAEHRPWG